MPRRTKETGYVRIECRAIDTTSPVREVPGTLRIECYNMGELRVSFHADDDPGPEPIFMWHGEGTRYQ